MIDITDRLVGWAQEITAFKGQVYRFYPQKKMAGKTFAIITPTGHSPRVMEDGEEVIADLTWNVEIYGQTPTTVDSILQDLTALYGKYNITLQGITHGYNPDIRQYLTQVSYSAVVDKRGCVFR